MCRINARFAKKANLLPLNPGAGYEAISSDIFIFTSLREGLPRVIVEASLLQLPVVTFEVEGVAEVLKNEKSGFIVPQGNKDILINRTEQLILQPELRLLFGQNARRHVIKYWDMHVMAQQLKIIYNRNS